MKQTTQTLSSSCGRTFSCLQRNVEQTTEDFIEVDVAMMPKCSLSQKNSRVMYATAQGSHLSTLITMQHCAMSVYY
eukprot:15326739-Ditylum_brightwellii.AAC.1